MAITAHEVGEFTLERQLLQQLAADHPDLAAAQQRLGVLLLEEGKLPAAEQAFQAVIQHGPQMPEGYVGLADVRIRQGDYQVAVNLLEKAIELDPKYQGAHFLLGSAYQRLGMTNKALPHLKLGAGARTRFVKDSLRIRADQYDVSTKARLARGIQFMVDRQAAQAATEFQKVLQAEPDNVTALSNLAGVFVQQNRLAEARQLLNKSLEIDSTKHATYVNLANLAALEGDLQKALEWADRGVELGSNAELPYRVRANILLQMERLEPAYDDALRAVELIPNDPQALEQCGDLAYRLRKLGDARTYYNRALRIDSRRPIAWIGLTQVNMTAGQFAEAKQTLANAQQLAPQHPAIKILSDRLDRLRSN
ncbi:MAG: tetratricopeptide repeat protein [Pirellulaceae bacterium]